MPGWLSEARAWRSASSRARVDGDVEPPLHQLQGDAAADRVLLLGEVHDAHAALAQGFEQDEGAGAAREDGIAPPLRGRGGFAEAEAQQALGAGPGPRVERGTAGGAARRRRRRDDLGRSSRHTLTPIEVVVGSGKSRVRIWRKSSTAGRGRTRRSDTSRSVTRGPSGWAGRARTSRGRRATGAGISTKPTSAALSTGAPCRLGRGPRGSLATRSTGRGGHAGPLPREPLGRSPGGRRYWHLVLSGYPRPDARMPRSPSLSPAPRMALDSADGLALLGHEIVGRTFGTSGP